MSTADLVGGLAGFALTLMVFSYLIGDNPLFRVAIHIFIGVASGYAAVVAVYNVLWPQLIRPAIAGSQPDRLSLLVPLVLSVFLLFKASRSFSRWGSWVVAFMVGVGMATAIGGAILGTLFPQANATVNLFDRNSLIAGGDGWLRATEGILILVGVLTALIYFHFSARPQAEGSPTRSPLIEGVAWVGQIFIAVTFGALFAGVYAAALAALIERLQFLIAFLLPLVRPG